MQYKGACIILKESKHGEIFQIMNFCLNRDSEIIGSLKQDILTLYVHSGTCVCTTVVLLN